jgi:hypothetical protein
VKLYVGCLTLIFACACRYCLTEGIHAGDVSADLSADGILVLTIRKLPQGLEFTERQLEQPAAEQQLEQPAAEQHPEQPAAEQQLEQPTAEQLPGTGSRCASLKHFREKLSIWQFFSVLFC